MAYSLSQKLTKSIIKKTNLKNDNLKNISIKQVKFTPENEWSSFDEDPDLFVDLYQSRINDFLIRKIDHQRMEKLLTPIFDYNHRIKIWNLIFPKINI